MSRSPPPSPDDVRALLLARYSQDEIALRLRATRHQVRKIIEAHGLRTRAVRGEIERDRAEYPPPSAPRRFSWEGVEP